MVAGDSMPGTTGNYLVLLEDDAAADAAQTMSRVAGLRTASTADASAGVLAAAQLSDADCLILHNLDVAVVSAAADQVDALARAADSPGPLALVEPERIVYAIGGDPAEATGATPQPAPAAPAAPPVDETTFTWGLQAVGVDQNTPTGAGIRVAVLDTGVDLDHPDLSGRKLVTRSFVQGQSVQDGHGHGTHCIGTSCGPRRPETGPGYGLASAAEIYAGKVLSDEGSGSDGGILQGISWAIENGCRVISMSLGAATTPGQAFSRVFERAARRALQRGTLIVAAAGNESDRSSGVIAPVGHPANCPSIMAVGAVDVRRQIADFSSGTVDAIGQVDVVGPGVDVYSAWPMPTRYRRISGTSMATPHAAGVAALIAQDRNARAWQLWAGLAQTARRLKLPSTDVGAGLVQVP